MQFNGDHLISFHKTLSLFRRILFRRRKISVYGIKWKRNAPTLYTYMYVYVHDTKLVTQLLGKRMVRKCNNDIRYSSKLTKITTNVVL